ncbi:MAG: hypothetical protein GWN86_21930, partial [Desulfobacterales bacterium]|nr:hypothetical protein [Desulfobacterales bacterium]
MPSPIAALPSPPNPGYIHVGPGEGYIKVAVSKGGLPPTAPWGHDGKICILEFEIIATPPEDGSLSSTLNIDNADTYLLDPTVSEIPDVTKEDGTYTFHYVSAPVLPHIWLEASPTSYQATKPRPFNVSINVQAVSAGDSLVGIQFVVGFNSTYLEVTEIMPGDFLSNPMWAPQGTQPTYYVDFRGVIYGELILPNMTGDYNPPFPSGNGTVATITFLPLLHQEADFNITVQPLFNTFFLDQHGDTLPYLSPQHCHYTYSPLPKPVLAVTPSTYIASHIGETFEIHINLENLDQRWKLTYAEFELQYGSDPLQVLNITEGDFLNQFGNVTFNYEHVNGSITADFTLMPSTHPQGDGTLLTITFNGTSSP